MTTLKSRHLRKWASKEGFAKNISGRTLLNVVEGEDKESDVEEEIGSGHEEEGEEEKKEEDSSLADSESERLEETEDFGKSENCKDGKK